MKKFTILILMFLSVNAIAQEFAPIGALWHYTQWTINPELITYKTIESLSDTMINGMPCRKLIEVERYIDTVNTTYHYMYSQYDSVFFFANGEFHLLYDFGANTGDTIILDHFQTFNGTPLKMIIDSMGMVDVSGEMKKIQYITCGDGIVIEFGQHVISGIGNTWFMFPTLDGTINGPLRCYQDNTTPVYFSPFYNIGGWNNEDCEEIITGIEEFNSDYKIILYPNPAEDIVFLAGLRAKVSFELRNNQGILIKQGELYPSNTIEINKFINGVYFLTLKGENLWEVRKIVKK